jgi:uncharacterized protein involved in exopolysaccharide biosynthesis
MSTQPKPLADLLEQCTREGKRRLVSLASIFAVTALVALGIVLVTPKNWEASATIVVEANNIIKPLMEGRAYPTSIVDQTALVTQKVQSKQIMRELMLAGGLLPPKMSPLDEERAIAKFRSKVHIDTKGEQIRVSYRDTDPKRTYLMANKIAEVYVREGILAKERESSEAFEFISKQVTEYSQKLTEAHEKLLAYYRHEETAKGAPAKIEAKSDGTPGGAVPASDEAPLPAGPRALGASVKSRATPEQIAALRMEETTLQAQLERRPAGPAANPNGRDDARQTEDAARNRVQQLQTELERLLTTCTEEHPDVKRVKRNIAAAQSELTKAEQARFDRESAKAAATALDDEVTRAARARLEEVRQQLSAATGVPRRRSSRGTTTAATTLAATEAAMVPEMRNVGQDTLLSELLRRYEATRDVYQDLLKRRENARVSMDLDVERRGLTLRVQEAAEMPLTAVGLRMFQQTAIGLVFALIVPLGFLAGIVKLDPRVRHPSQIERIAKVPLLAAIPVGRPRNPTTERDRRQLALAMVIGVLVVYAAVFIVKMTLSKGVSGGGTPPRPRAMRNGKGTARWGTGPRPATTRPSRWSAAPTSRSPSRSRPASRPASRWSGSASCAPACCRWASGATSPTSSPWSFR